MGRPRRKKAGDFPDRVRGRKGRPPKAAEDGPPPAEEGLPGFAEPAGHADVVAAVLDGQEVNYSRKEELEVASKFDNHFGNFRCPKCGGDMRPKVDRYGPRFACPCKP